MINLSYKNLNKRCLSISFQAWSVYSKNNNDRLRLKMIPKRFIYTDREFGVSEIKEANDLLQVNIITIDIRRS